MTDPLVHLEAVSYCLTTQADQPHPAGSVRIVGDFGVLRWEGLI